MKTAVATDDGRVIVGHGTFRITLEGGGITKFECWDQDEDGNVKAHFYAPPDLKDMPLPGEET